MHPHRPGIDILLHAHDYIWGNEAIALSERLAASNVLYSLAARLFNDTCPPEPDPPETDANEQTNH